MKRIILSALGALLLAGAAAAQIAGTSAPMPVPVFQPDTTWPQALPNNWVLNNVTKVSADRNDNIYILHRPRQTPAGRERAPSVVVVDANGKFIRAWGGPAQGYDWPDVEHNVFVDHNDNVYISGSSPGGGSTSQISDDVILKFTAEGKFLRQFGGLNRVTGSHDTTAVNKPGDFYVWPKTNELFVADGYGNRRVLVLDAQTLAFKRMWGAFGRPPTDDASSGGQGNNGVPGRGQVRPAPDAATVPTGAEKEGPGADRFVGAVHGIIVSNDGIVYVGDRNARRVQMFTVEGKYIDQFFLNRLGPSAGTVSGFAFSPDAEQRYLYVTDFFNSHIAVFERKSRRFLYQFGLRGAQPGNFQGLHHIAVDTKGNIYTSETAPGSRAQKLVFQGMSSTLPANALPENAPDGAAPATPASSAQAPR
jgi:hypothetical protein